MREVVGLAINHPLHEIMNAPSRSFADDGIINYTLSLAAVKSGYMTAVPTMVSGDSEGDGYEIETREEEADEESMEIVGIRQTESPESEAEEEETTRSSQHSLKQTTSPDSHVEAELVDEEETIQSLQYTKQPPRWEGRKVSSSLKTTKKKVSRFLGKIRKKGSSISLATSTRSRSFGGKTFSAATSSGEESSREEASLVEQEEGTKVAIEPVVVEEEETEPTATPEEQLPTSPTERTASDIAERTPSKQDSYSSTHVSETEKKANPDRLENTDAEPQVMKEDRHDVPQNQTSETGETDEDDSYVDDEAHTFNISQVSKRTYIMNDSASVVEDMEESWSREDRVQTKGWFGCGMCGPVKEEWEESDNDDDDDFTVESGSEEGRVADAVITIQEHASRLGVTEYELLEMIQHQ